VPTVIAHRGVKDVQQWLAPPGREEFFRPIGTGGFEPPTPATQRRCATRLRYVP
jgi:hypothetical protein